MTSVDSIRNDEGQVIPNVNCNTGELQIGDIVNVTSTTPDVWDYLDEDDNVLGETSYYPAAFKDCGGGNKNNLDNDPKKSCSDCTRGAPVKDPLIQPQTTPYGIQGGMYREDVRGRNGPGVPCSRGDHFGVDIQNAQGAPIYAMFDGVATITPNGGDAGNYVSIVSTVGDNTIKAYYFHLEDDNMVSGNVSAGDIIGYQGDTVNLIAGIEEGSTESHVHIKVRLNGEVVDPLPYFKTEFNSTTGEVETLGCN